MGDISLKDLIEQPWLSEDIRNSLKDARRCRIRKEFNALTSVQRIKSHYRIQFKHNVRNYHLMLHIGLPPEIILHVFEMGQIDLPRKGFDWARIEAQSVLHLIWTTLDRNIA